MNWLEFIFIVITGFTASAEFGSFAFVHPVVKRLPSKHHIMVEKGLVGTFGVFMPFAMTICSVIGISFAFMTQGEPKHVHVLAISSALSFALSIAFTLAINVPRNFAVTKWDVNDLPSDWKRQRNLWEIFQGIRATLLLIGFLLLVAGILSMHAR